MMSTALRYKEVTRVALLPSPVLRALLNINTVSCQDVSGCWWNEEGQWIYGNPTEAEYLTRIGTKPVPSAYRRALPQLGAARLVKTLPYISIRKSGIVARHVVPASNWFFLFCLYASLWLQDGVYSLRFPLRLCYFYHVSKLAEVILWEFTRFIGLQIHPLGTGFICWPMQHVSDVPTKQVTASKTLLESQM
jgi:hypothetical protein